ncbi:MAG: hypothetical protein WC178_03800 [Candidatus Paceibacterota bacterium]
MKGEESETFAKKVFMAILLFFIGGFSLKKNFGTGLEIDMAITFFIAIASSLIILIFAIRQTHQSPKIEDDEGFFNALLLALFAIGIIALLSNIVFTGLLLLIKFMLLIIYLYVIICLTVEMCPGISIKFWK